ncbi:MAG: hypothetical protein NXH80_01265 [Rhodobacteraceae bacterium]|nr:hypothetical protein [Paracoccaceae bacterium]
MRSRTLHHQFAAKPHTANPPRIADARGGDPTVESLDLSQPRPKKFKAEHWPHQIAAAWGRVMPKACLRHGDARRAAPAVSRELGKTALTGLGHNSPMLRCGPSKLPFVHPAAFYRLKRRSAGLCSLLHTRLLLTQHLLKLRRWQFGGAALFTKAVVQIDQPSRALN